MIFDVLRGLLQKSAPGFAPTLTRMIHQRIVSLSSFTLTGIARRPVIAPL